MAKAENKVEKYLDKCFKERGGTTRKWVSPGRDGVPDRICILPVGRIYLVEVKTLSGKMSVRQQRECDTLADLGCYVHVVYGTEGVDNLMRSIDV